MTDNLLHIHKINFAQDTQSVLKNISVSMITGQRIAIAGETGSGKSTLLKIIAGLEQPTSGEVLLNNQIVRGPADQLVPGHPQIAYLSQHFELPKFLRVEQVLSYVNQLSESKAAKIFSVCRINHLMQRKTHELSGGEMQRIAIARMLIQQPQLLLLDEPYSHLDIPLKNILKQVIYDIGNKLKISCILVSHDPEDILPWANVIIILKSGKIVQQGSPTEIYHTPVNEYVAGLFGYFTAVDTKWIKKLGIKTKSKKLFIRPENFNIATRTQKSISTTISDIQYFGNHFTLTLDTKEKQFLLAVNSTNFKIGESIKLACKIKSA